MRGRKKEACVAGEWKEMNEVKNDKKGQEKRRLREKTERLAMDVDNQERIVCGKEKIGKWRR